jgi:MurNAc alpha-1-phosphate uridylyltransferase
MSVAMILAAGRGERMRPLTGRTAKPLLEVGGRRLIEWHLEALVRAGVRYVVINTSHLAEQFPDTLGDGSRYGLRIRYSYEGAAPLETGGGLLRALPLLAADTFIAINGDVWTDFDPASLPKAIDGIAHLVMVENPAHHPNGDFVLRDGRLHDEAAPRLTFAGIAVYRRALFDGLKPGTWSIVPRLREAMRAGQVTGQLHAGRWSDVGTPERLAALDGELRARGVPTARPAG